MQNINKIVLLATWFRIFLLCFQYVVNIYVEDFDSSTWIAYPNGTAEGNRFLNGLNKWDAVYFNYVIQYGYTYEQMLAFYPGLTYPVKFISGTISSEPSLFLMQIVCCLTNSIFFVLAVSFLYKLSLKISLSCRFAAISSVLFIINPANVFMMSSYTESQFCCLQFALMYFLECEKFWMSCWLVSASLLTRSNGYLSVVFFVYFYTKHELFPMRSCKLTLSMKLISLCCHLTLPLLVCVFHHYYIYRLFCNLSHVYSSSSDHWCNKLMPVAYGYVQETYWNVGMFKYWEWKQLPNFLLAVPIVSMVILQLRLYSYCVSFSTHFEIVKNLGFVNIERERYRNSAKEIISPSRKFVYLVHCCFLAFAGIFAFHVQILTRMLCSSTPLIYWTCAELISNETKNRLTSRIVIGYFLTYCFIGILVHCNFYPWT